MTAIEQFSLSSAVFLATGALGLAFLLRYLPHVLAPLGIGVDHWYWKAYVEKYRSARAFPPHLPQFIFDVKQSYPPLFPLLLAFLPHALFDRFSHILAIGIDLVRMACLMAIVYSLTGGNAFAVGVAGAVYAVTPLLVSYNVQLNPRGLAAIMLDVMFFAVILAFFFKGPVWLWVVLIPSSGLILLTHKMTTQLFWFLCLAGSILLDWHLILLIPLSVAVAMVMSRGFYWSVLAAHWDVVSFYLRNWRWAGANPVKESPIYGNYGYETPKKMHRKGALGIVKHIYVQFGYNPFAWLLMIVVPIFRWIPDSSSGFNLFVLGWLSLTLAFALGTALVPVLRCIGAGHLYLYNAAFPSALLWGLLFHNGYTHAPGLLLAGAVASLLGILRFYWHVKSSPTIKIDNEFERVLMFLSTKRDGTVMCVPPQWYDVVAYKTGLPVLYGGHGFGFKLLEETYPRLLIPLREVIERFNVRFIILESGAATKKFIADIPGHEYRDFGKYRVFCIRENS
jgi:hypothetical protein